MTIEMIMVPAGREMYILIFDTAESHVTGKGASFVLKK